MKNNIYFGIFMILLGTQFIYILKTVEYYAFTINYIPSILIIILGIMQIIIPFLYSIYKNPEKKDE